ncbi:gluconate 2-dehydrogenase subunit 3 family protein [Luteolibacter marinus]|uniref:gluconate 2-dehydrogenase subunit 3 family protein n=1 Tax=Luteolibacter marinus TaxID=2776705 RepID=UPI00186852CD|nr:gluconate 2-dehydrogenase subunit 3 family protein [Luteolibacter marinus]
MNPSTVSRRDIFKLVAAASATGALLPAGASPPPLARNFKNILSDPDYSNPDGPWEKPLTEPELATLTVLVDLILPADDESPAASAIGLPDFLNEWVGAPYAENKADLEILRGGVAWINTRAFKLHGKEFGGLAAEQQTAILDSICDPAKAAPELAAGARFFSKLRMLSLGGYYSHSSTWKSLGYVGNVAIAGPYPGVPDEIIKLLGLEGEI